MSTASQIGYGMGLLHSTTLGGSYAAVGSELLEIAPPEPSIEQLKVYRSDNSAAVVEKVNGWTDYGNATATVTYTPGNRAAVEGFLGVPGFFKVQYPKCTGQSSVGDSEIFAGTLIKIGKETPIKDVMKVKIEPVATAPAPSPPAANMRLLTSSSEPMRLSPR